MSGAVDYLDKMDEDQDAFAFGASSEDFAGALAARLYDLGQTRRIGPVGG